jgi:aspartate racemase
MKTVGIIGGIGPESTIVYYRSIISSYRDLVRDGSYPQIIINSIDMKRMLDLIGAGELEGATVYLGEEVKKLADAGTDFGLLASNTPHIVFDGIQAISPIPLISIVEVTCERAVSLGLQKVGLFGTRFTMESQFYQRVFSGRNISIVVPDPDERYYIHEKYMGELVNGILLDETRSRLLEIARTLKERKGIEALILGGTELPLILGEGDGEDIPFLDTTRIHVEAIVDRLVQNA